MLHIHPSRKSTLAATHLRRLPLAAGIGLVALVGFSLLLGARPRPVLADPVSLFVKPHVTGTCTIADPCSLQTALGTAVDGDVIYMSGGTYTDTAPATSVAYIDQSISLLGGWDGFTSKPPIRNPDANITTLDGENQRIGIYIDGDYSAPITVTLDGLQVTRGWASDRGGGIYARYASVHIEDCHVLSSTAGTAGGGIYLNYAHNSVLTHNQVYSNTSDFDGGGIYVSWSNGVTVAKSTVYENTAANQGGGLFVFYSDQASLVRNTIYSNTANSDCGGIRMITSNGVTIARNTLFGNVAPYGGGIISVNSDDVTLSSNTVRGNRTTSSGVGGIQIHTSDNVLLVNNVVVDNQIHSGEGAGIFIYGSDARLIHTTVARNRGGTGHGIYLQSSGNPVWVWLTNTILVSQTVGIEVAVNSTATLAATLWGTDTWANGTDTLGTNITTSGDLWGDPAFDDPDGGDYGILSTSVAVNAGFPMLAVREDIGGHPRPDCVAWDLGAYEAQDAGCNRIHLPLALRGD